MRLDLRQRGLHRRVLRHQSRLVVRDLFLECADARIQGADLTRQQRVLFLGNSGLGIGRLIRRGRDETADAKRVHDLAGVR